ncbi:ribonuclease MC-like [Cucurbita maxima]|uniref:Ribonuclease MC-like n=1 Tax=Cucurbita maxima TaxID=3661 RepID=A0A6J1HV84_CUCMA|nr:ribonuclease MC-like [Cucurbita maxima]
MAHTHLILLSLSLSLSTLIFSVNAQFELFQLVQQWPPATCTNVHCGQLPTPTRFTIHGLWPANYTKPYLVCSGGTKFSETIQGFSALKPALVYYWPNLKKGSHKSFWRKEWDKHGACSENVFNQVQYFQTALNIRTNPKYDLLAILNAANLGPTGNIFRQYHVIENAIKAATGKKPGLRCNTNQNTKQTQLHEIVLCFDKDGATIIDCPFANCPKQFVFSITTLL